MGNNISCFQKDKKIKSLSSLDKRREEENVVNLNDTKTFQKATSEECKNNLIR